MKVFNILLLSLVPSVLTAQVVFQKTFGHANYDNGYSVQQTLDGGYIIAGETNSFGAGNYDIYLMKTDVDGDTLWTRTFGGADYEYGISLQQTTDSGYIITGTTWGFGAGGTDVYLIKTNSSGDTLWTKTYGGTNADEGRSVQQTTDGGYIIAGTTRSFGAGIDDVYLIKTDINGNMLWTKTFGGADYEHGYSVQQTADGGYIITGDTRSFGAGDLDVYLIKTDSVGNAQWTKAFGGADIDYGVSIQQTTDEGYIITGMTYSFGAGNGDMYLIKTDSVGNALWSKTFGGIYSDWGSSVQQTIDGGYIITGSTQSFGAGQSDIYLIKTDINGDTLWTKTYGGTGIDYGNPVQQTTDGGYIIAGSTEGLGAGLNDIYLIKTNASGNSGGCNEYSTNTAVGNPQTVTGSPVAIVGSGALAGNPATLVGNPALIESVLCFCDTTVIAAFNYSVNNLIVSFSDSSLTATSWYWNFGDGNFSTSQNPIYAYAIPGTYYVCLYASNICDTDTICDSISVTNVGINQSSISNNQFTIYPNPSGGKFKVEGLKFGVEKVEVFDLFGRKVLESKETEIDMRGFAKGMYVYVVKGEGESEIGRGKVVIE